MKIVGMLFAAAAVLSLSAASVQASDTRGTLPLAQPKDQSRLFHKTAGYCNFFGCFGNICYTPAGACVQVNYTPVGTSCFCPDSYGNTIYGSTGS